MNREVGRAVPCAPRRWKARPSLYDGAHPSSVAALRRVDGVTRPTCVCAGQFCLLLAAVVLVGCQSTSFSSYLSPRVTGRVLAADTRRPVADVKIRRVNPAANQDFDDPAKG